MASCVDRWTPKTAGNRFSRPSVRRPQDVNLTVAVHDWEGGCGLCLPVSLGWTPAAGCGGLAGAVRGAAAEVRQCGGAGGGPAGRDAVRRRLPAPLPLHWGGMGGPRGPWRRAQTWARRTAIQELKKYIIDLKFCPQPHPPLDQLFARCLSCLLHLCPLVSKSTRVVSKINKSTHHPVRRGGAPVAVQHSAISFGALPEGLGSRLLATTYSGGRTSARRAARSSGGWRTTSRSWRPSAWSCCRPTSSSSAIGWSGRRHA